MCAVFGYFKGGSPPNLFALGNGSEMIWRVESMGASTCYTVSFRVKPHSPLRDSVLKNIRSRNTVSLFLVVLLAGLTLAELPLPAYAQAEKSKTPQHVSLDRVTGARALPNGIEIRS